LNPTLLAVYLALCSASVGGCKKKAKM